MNYREAIERKHKLENEIEATKNTIKTLKQEIANKMNEGAVIGALKAVSNDAEVKYEIETEHSDGSILANSKIDVVGIITFTNTILCREKDDPINEIWEYLSDKYNLFNLCIQVDEAMSHKEK